jgi:DNA-binding response OmpR family regulator
MNYATTPAVLVVEDNWQIARSIRKWLEEEDLWVIGPAPTVDQARELVKRKKPDIAVVDINLRGEMSYSLIDRLKKNHVEVIVITGYGADARDLDEDDLVLEKPLSREALIEAVRERAAA